MEFIAVFLAYCTLTEQVLLSKNQFKETLLEVINALLLWRMKKNNQMVSFFVGVENKHNFVFHLYFV